MLPDTISVPKPICIDTARGLSTGGLWVKRFGHRASVISLVLQLLTVSAASLRFRSRPPRRVKGAIVVSPVGRFLATRFREMPRPSARCLDQVWAAPLG